MPWNLSRCSGRNTAVCKICRKDDGDDWLGCDGCGQFFHANCKGVDFATALILNTFIVNELRINFSCMYCI